MGLKISQTNTATQTFYGHGKLLLTGEYFVLDGAHALAVPTRLGQWLRIKKLHANGGLLYWVALNSKKQPWLNLVFETGSFNCINSKSDEARRLSKILTEARKLNPDFLTDEQDLAVETQLEFPNEWGLGSSSTLIYCIAEWAKVDGYGLLKATIGGSGYDVACAGADSAILYQLRDSEPTIFHLNWEPPFKDKLYFAYTGRKQLSSEAIQYYRTKLQDKTYAIGELNRITDLMLSCHELKEFESLIREHENLVAEQLKQTKLSDTIFADFEGTVKSLGAWGGDFVMLVYEDNENELRDYLKKKNISIAFKWDELILTKGSNATSNN
jgi:mevalonate kinase